MRAEEITGEPSMHKKTWMDQAAGGGTADGEGEGAAPAADGAGAPSAGCVAVGELGTDVLT